MIQANRDPNSQEVLPPPGTVETRFLSYGQYRPLVNPLMDSESFGRRYRLRSNYSLLAIAEVPLYDQTSKNGTVVRQTAAFFIVQSGTSKGPALLYSSLIRPSGWPVKEAEPAEVTAIDADSLWQLDRLGSSSILYDLHWGGTGYREPTEIRQAVVLPGEGRYIGRGMEAAFNAYICQKTASDAQVLLSSREHLQLEIADNGLLGVTDWSDYGTLTDVPALRDSRGT